MMKSHRVIAVFAAVAFATLPTVGTAAEKQIKDVKELAGTWQGWVTSQLGAQSRASMIIKADGSYESSTTAPGGTLTQGAFYLEGGKLRYRSSRTAGAAAVAEDKGKMTLTVKPDGTVNPDTGPATYERVK